VLYDSTAISRIHLRIAVLKPAIDPDLFVLLYDCYCGLYVLGHSHSIVIVYRSLRHCQQCCFNPSSGNHRSRRSQPLAKLYASTCSMFSSICACTTCGHDDSRALQASPDSLRRRRELETSVTVSRYRLGARQKTNGTADAVGDTRELKSPRQHIASIRFATQGQSWMKPRETSRIASRPTWRQPVVVPASSATPHHTTSIDRLETRPRPQWTPPARGSTALPGHGCSRLYLEPMIFMERSSP